MSDQTPDTPPDPWDELKRQSERHAGTVGVSRAIDTARAQVEAQHRQEVDQWKRFAEAEYDRRVEVVAEVARLSTQVERWKQSSDEQMRSAAEECDRADTLRVELDAAHQEIARHRLAALEAAALLGKVQGENARLRAALEQLRDCDWTIGRGDRMDAVRDIARAALTPPEHP